MKQKTLNSVMLTLFVSGTLVACSSSNSEVVSLLQPASTDVLFICGGNTGRSPSAEALANANGTPAFSRASGLDANDPLNVESGALSALTRLAESQHKNSDFYTRYILERKAQQLTYEDILKSSAIYPMTEAHLCRVALIIELNADSELEAKQEFDKVHLLSSCATGKYTPVPDGFGVAESKEFVVYNEIIQQLNGYVLAIKNNHNSCVTTIESSPLSSSLGEAVDSCCSKYSLDLNKRYNNYCITQQAN